MKIERWNGKGFTSIIIENAKAEHIARWFDANTDLRVSLVRVNDSNTQVCVWGKLKPIAAVIPRMVLELGYTS